MGKPFGVKFSHVTQSKVLRTDGPATFYGIHMMATSKATVAVYNSGTSGVPAAVAAAASGNTLTVLPKTTVTSGGTWTEVINFGDRGVRCSDGLWLFMAKTSGGTALVRYQ